MRVIKGDTIEEQILSIDTYLYRTRELLAARKMASLIAPCGVSAYARQATAGEEFGHTMIPVPGKISSVILRVDDVPRIPADLKEPIVAVEVIVEADGANWISLSIPVVPKKLVKVSGQALEVIEGTRMKFSVDRAASGVWICCVVDPKARPINVEIAYEGIQLRS